MIKLFRNARRQMLFSNKIQKYLQYAIGEIALVVIGILIALQINSWHEQKKKLNLSDEALAELYDEVETTIKLIHKKNEINVLASDIMKKYLEDGYANPTDSIKRMVVGWSFAYNAIQPSIPIIERELSTKNVIIGQKKLVDKLQEFKNVQIFTDQLKFYLDNFWNESVITYLRDQKLMLSLVSSAGMIDKKVKGMGILYDSEEFKDLIAMEFMHVESYAKEIKKLELILQEIKVELETIINPKD